MWTISNAAQFDTPYLAIHRDIVEQNIQQLIALFGGTERLRPHVKTHKCAEVVKLMLQAGIHKFKCATIAEAELIALAGGLDILLAYEVVGTKIDRFIQLIVAYPNAKFSCLISTEMTARQLSSAAGRAGVRATMLLDLNVGMNRTGIPPDQAAYQLYAVCRSLPNLHVGGLHAYDGHLTDANAAVRLTQAKEGFRTVQELVDQLRSVGQTVSVIVAGSTPTVAFYAAQASVECSPGTFIYWDQQYQDRYPELPFTPAAVLLSRVIDTPSEEVICLDLGYKAISSEDSPEACARFASLTDASILSQSEEHMLVAIKGEKPAVGELVYVLPYHIGRTCNLYAQHFVVVDQAITDTWSSIAAIRMISI